MGWPKSDHQQEEVVLVRRWWRGAGPHTASRRQGGAPDAAICRPRGGFGKPKLQTKKEKEPVAIVIGIRYWIWH